MKHFIMILILLLGISVSYADINVDQYAKLSPEQRQLVQQQIDQLAKSSGGIGSPDVSSPEKLDEWVTVGDKISKVIGNTAKELGIATNEFANSRVGQITLFLIIWKIFGSMAIHVFFAVFILILGFLTIRWFTNNARDIQIEYDDEKVNWFGNHPIKHKVLGTLSDDWKTGSIVVYIILTIVSLITAFTW